MRARGGGVPELDRRGDVGSYRKDELQTPRLRRFFAGAIRDLSPAYFAMPMATGIVSIAAHLHQMPNIALALFFLNLGVYGVLWVLTALRLIFYPSQFFTDIVEHNRAHGFFTAVAGTCVIGSQLAIIFHAFNIAVVFFLFGCILWLSLTYTIFTALFVKEQKPTLANGIVIAHGAGQWLQIDCPANARMMAW